MKNVKFALVLGALVTVLVGLMASATPVAQPGAVPPVVQTVVVEATKIVEVTPVPSGPNPYRPTEPL